MSRYSTAQPTPPQPALDGDSSFMGLDMVTPREKLTPGYYPLAINKRSSTGDMETRAGTMMPVFANMPDFNKEVYQAFLGSGSFSNPHGVQSRLLATPTLVFVIRDGGFPGSVEIPDGITLAGQVEFSQQSDKVLLHCPEGNDEQGAGSGEQGVQLIWDGVSPAGFVRAAVSDPLVTFTSTLPRATPWSVSLANRAIIPIGVSQLAASDILDYTTFDLTLTGPKLRTNSGTADPIVGLFPYAQNSLIVGKRDSIDLVTGYTGDLSQTSVQVLSTTVGICARKAVAMTGGDLIFPHDTGVYKISQVVQDRLETSPVPVGARTDGEGNIVNPIAPLLKRINWAVADKQRGVVHGAFYYWAVALDGAPGNNAVLVFNLFKNAWEGIDLWSTEISGQRTGASLLAIDDLYVAKYLGTNRVWAIDYGAKAIYLLYEGKTDLLATGEYPVADLFETRAYDTKTWDPAIYGRAPQASASAKRMEIALRTWAPSIVITQLMDGEFEERVLTLAPITFNRRRYRVWGKADFAGDNAAGDWETPGREDYSIEDGNYFDGAAGLTNGIDADRKTTQPPLLFSLDGRGRYAGFRIANSQGQCDVTGVLFESTGNQRELRRT